MQYHHEHSISGMSQDVPDKSREGRLIGQEHICLYQSHPGSVEVNSMGSHLLVDSALYSQEKGTAVRLSVCV